MTLRRLSSIFNHPLTTQCFQVTTQNPEMLRLNVQNLKGKESDVSVYHQIMCIETLQVQKQCQ